MRDLPACHLDRRAATHQGAQRCRHLPATDRAICRGRVCGGAAVSQRLSPETGTGSVGGYTAGWRRALASGRFSTVRLPDRAEDQVGNASFASTPAWGDCPRPAGNRWGHGSDDQERGCFRLQSKADDAAISGVLALASNPAKGEPSLFLVPFVHLSGQSRSAQPLSFL